MEWVVEVDVSDSCECSKPEDNKPAFVDTSDEEYCGKSVLEYEVGTDFIGTAIVPNMGIGTITGGDLWDMDCTDVWDEDDVGNLAGNKVSS